jgi:hypothetical protein
MPLRSEEANNKARLNSYKSVFQQLVLIVVFRLNPAFLLKTVPPAPGHRNALKTQKLCVNMYYQDL